MKQIPYDKCKNEICITFFTNTIEESEELYEKIHWEISRFSIYIPPHSSLDVPTKEFVNLIFYSDYECPIEELQKICEVYKVDIMGVANEFNHGYVEAFTLFYDHNKTDSIDSHFIKFQSSEEETSSGFGLDEENEENILTSDEKEFG